jgi:predicted nuclease of predicted toxin-antitoxin system
MSKILIDSSLSKNAFAELRDSGYDALWVPEMEKDPGDIAIMEWALNENRVLVTMDKDFGELVFVFNKPYPPIIRLVDFRPVEQGEAIISVIKKYYELLVNEKPIITIEDNRIRIRTKEH